VAQVPPPVATVPITVAGPAPVRRGRSPLGALGRIGRTIWRLVTTNRKVMAGSVLVTFFILVAIFGPLFVAQNPNRITSNLLAPPSSAHLLGTNQLGQDLFSQLVVGTRSSVFWSFAAGMLVMVIAVTIGLVSGYFGGTIDDVLTLITNVFLVIPAFPLAVICVQFFSRSTVVVAVVVALTNWPWGARVMRAQTLSIRNREFITAARANGESTWRMIFFDIFPNEASIVAASFITTTIQVLLQVAGLEFLGFGDSSAVSWGVMLNAAINGSALLQGAWWWLVPPGLCIALLGSGLALLNFGIDEIADPRLRTLRRRPQGWVGPASAVAIVFDLLSPRRRRARRGKVSRSEPSKSFRGGAGA
jgi:peptide/nickel transport system permease protein